MPASTRLPVAASGATATRVSARAQRTRARRGDPPVPDGGTGTPPSRRLTRRRPAAATIVRSSASIDRSFAPMNRSPASIHQSPALTNRPPAWINRSPVSMNRSPASINRSPALINRSPVSNIQSRRPNIRCRGSRIHSHSSNERSFRSLSFDVRPRRIGRRRDSRVADRGPVAGEAWVGKHASVSLPLEKEPHN